MHIDDDDLVKAIILAEVLSDDPPPPPASRPLGPHDFARDPSAPGAAQAGPSETGCATVGGGCLAVLLMFVGLFTVMGWLLGGCTGFFD